MVVLIGDNNPVLVVTGNGSWSLEFTLFFSTLSKFVLESAFLVKDFNPVVGSVGHQNQTVFSATNTPRPTKLALIFTFRTKQGHWVRDTFVVATHTDIDSER